MKIGKTLIPIMGLVMLIGTSTWGQGPRLRGQGAAPPGEALQRGGDGPQRPGGPRRGGPVAGLRRALQEVGQPLSDGQVSQFQTLFEANKPSDPGSDRDEMKDAHQAYQEAVLAKNLGAAQTQAQVIAGLIAQATQQKLQRQADLQIGVLGILTADQVSALLGRFGTHGLFRLLPGGGPGHGFHGGPPRAPKPPGE